jgi:hypothetical protein
MNKYKVYGHTTVTVVVEVEAESEGDAYEEAYNQLSELTAYFGNGGTDKIIGVDDYESSISADEGIDYFSAELIEDEDDDDADLEGANT